MKYNTFIMAISLMLASCDWASSSPESKASEKALAFSEAYFNYHLTQAVKHVTPESVPFLSYAASNVTQDDIDLINSQKSAATVSVSDVEWVNDTMAVVTVTVNNYIRKDSLFAPAHLSEHSTYRLTVVERNSNLFVKMAGLPRSERQSRD